MSDSKLDKSTAGPFKLEEGLGMGVAQSLATRILGHRASPLSIDASDVQYIGGQCMQILVSAAATWKRDGLAFEIISPSTAFTESVRLLGVAPLLPCRT